MSYKEEIREKIMAIDVPQRPYEDAVNEIIEDVYKRALQEAKVTGQSVESVTYEILEGIGEALEDKNELILQNATDKITKIIHDSAHNCINLSAKKAHHANLQFEETFEREKEHLKESLDAFKAFAKEHSLSKLTMHLTKTEASVKSLIHSLSEKFKSHKKGENHMK